MSASISFWRKMRTDSAAARLTALLALIVAIGLCALLIALPLMERLADARRTAANLDLRSAALRDAAAERLAEAEIAAPSPAVIAEATAYLATHAPVGTRNAAMLDLLSSVRLIAQASDVKLTATAPIDINRGEARLFDLVDGSGMSILAAEARIVADHQGIARFLMAIEQARPVLRAATLDITAKTSRADQETDRLSARVLIGAIIREAPEE
ncbi:MAG: hypothetical protein P8Q48_17715 [Paracoccaceae bacterium]|nr:hypothetical protein [Paracoccaceae bacterium]MDG1372043.1 hypothetical protein [Paracoccaceae bacterium]